MGTHSVEGVVASAACQQAEGKQQGQAAEGGHDEIYKAGLGVSFIAMMRHDQRPRGQRHQFPCEEKREGIVGDGDQDHAGEERRVERQNSFGVRLVAAVTEREQAGACAPESDQDEEEAGQGIKPEIRPDPGETERKLQVLDWGGERLQAFDRQANREQKAAAIAKNAGRGETRGDGPDEGKGQKRAYNDNGIGHISRPAWLGSLVPISSMPEAASAFAGFIGESTLPRITPSLASRRWMVGRERPKRSARAAGRGRRALRQPALGRR